MELSDGYHSVPRGKLAAVQTFLQMHVKPSLRPVPMDATWRLERATEPDLARYRALFHRVGDEYLWTLRLLMPDDELQRYLDDPGVELYVLVTPRGDEGILELDFRMAGECEVALFGVAQPLLRTGAGRWLMNHALEIAWSRPIARFWLHTCSLDHPSALAFYQRTGFEPYARAIEIFPDPRRRSLTRADAAPGVPIL
jgi:GNAT superfamily N-acetyltransferase